MFDISYYLFSQKSKLLEVIQLLSWKNLNWETQPYLTPEPMTLKNVLCSSQTFR